MCLRILRIINFFPIYLKFQYALVFRRGDMQALPSSVQGAASMTTSASLDNSLSDMYRSPPRPLPYDADPRFFRSQHDRLVSRREKGSSHLNEESELLRGDVDADTESFNSSGKWNESTGKDGSKEYRSKSSARLSSAKLTTGAELVYLSSEEEDVCPTCLEGWHSSNFMQFHTHIFIRRPLSVWTQFRTKCWTVECLNTLWLNFPCRIHRRESQDNDKMFSSLSSRLHIRVDGKKRQLSCLWEGNIISTLNFSNSFSLLLFNFQIAAISALQRRGVAEFSQTAFVMWYAI